MWERVGGWTEKTAGLERSPDSFFILLPWSTADGKWGPWNHWSLCSKTCGTGWQRRFRMCQGTSVQGYPCEGSGEEVKTCNEKKCPGTSCIVATQDCIPPHLHIQSGRSWTRIMGLVLKLPLSYAAYWVCAFPLTKGLINLRVNEILLLHRWPLPATRGFILYHFFIAPLVEVSPSTVSLLFLW